ncbi:MAG: FHA domain-containing protein [Deltaproteobacteria bacterium]|nr:FHA domain-containing protein [Deltaproteobacteria bacterium]
MFAADANPTGFSVDEWGLVSLPMEDMAQELDASGEDAFREKYTCGFLVLLQGPPRKDEWIDLKTSESSAPDLPPLRKFEHQRAIPLVNSDRNAFDSKIMVGRARNNDIVIRAPKISKLHSAFIPDGQGGYALVDMGSRNGTIVNGKRLGRKEQAQLASGDIILFWRYMFLYVDQENMLARLKDREIPEP